MVALRVRGTGCEFYGAPKLLAWAKVEGHSCFRKRCGQNNAWDAVAADGTGMCVVAAVSGPCAPDALISYVSVFSHDFTR